MLVEPSQALGKDWRRFAGHSGARLRSRHFQRSVRLRGRTGSRPQQRCCNTPRSPDWNSTGELCSACPGEFPPPTTSPREHRWCPSRSGAWPCSRRINGALNRTCRSHWDCATLCKLRPPASETWFPGLALHGRPTTSSAGSSMRGADYSLLPVTPDITTEAYRLKWPASNANAALLAILYTEPLVPTPSTIAVATTRQFAANLGQTVVVPVAAGRGTRIATALACPGKSLRRASVGYASFAQHQRAPGQLTARLNPLARSPAHRAGQEHLSVRTVWPPPWPGRLSGRRSAQLQALWHLCRLLIFQPEDRCGLGHPVSPVQLFRSWGNGSRLVGIDASAVRNRAAESSAEALAHQPVRCILWNPV